MRQEYLRAAAEAYANLSAFESDCYHYLNDGLDATIQARLATSYSERLSAEIHPKYIYKIICTALTECQYPINEATGYAWSANERAAFAGISKATWSRNEFSEKVNFILKDINANSRAVSVAIDSQLL